MKCDKKRDNRGSKKSRSRDSKSRRKSSSHNRDELDYADPTNSAGSSSFSSSSSISDGGPGVRGPSVSSYPEVITKINRSDYQADDPEMSTCTFHDTNPRSLCAIIGSSNSFRIKNWEGRPHTSCPVTDGAHPIFSIPHVLVMGTFTSQRLTKVSKRNIA